MTGDLVYIIKSVRTPDGYSNFFLRLKNGFDEFVRSIAIGILASGKFLYRSEKIKFVAVDIVENSLRTTRFALYPSRNEIVFGKIKNFPLAGRDPTIVLEETSRKPSFFKPKLVIGFDSRQAATVRSVIAFSRSSPKDPIGKAELENVLAQSVWQFLNAYRNWAANKMDLNDFDVILSQLDVRRIILDSRKSLDPIGEKSGSISIELEGTFLPRRVISAIKKLSSRFESVSAVELAFAWSAAVGKPHLLLNWGESKVSCFGHWPDQIIHIHDFKWGKEQLVSALARELGVDAEVAKFIWERYIRKDLSEKFSEFLDKFFLRELSSFFAGLKRLRLLSPDIHLAKTRNPQPVYMNDISPLPDSIDGYRERGRRHSWQLKKIDWREIISNKGLRIRGRNLDAAGTKKCLLSVVAALSDPPPPQYEKFNNLLIQRSRWLTFVD